MELIGEKRQKIGKVVRSLRKEGLIPAVVFGNEIESTAIVLNRMAFSKLFSKAGETALVDLKIESTTYKVLVNDVQLDPISGQIIHAGFYKPNLKEKTEVHIPVRVIGEETNPLIKSGEAVALQLMNEILVSALPSDLPEAFVIDIKLR
jgi:large subunit ribosomal protein L25